MKKVLIISLIFVVTSIANATPTWTITDVPISPEYEITVSVIDNPEDALFLALAVDSYGVLSDFAAGADAPQDWQQYGTLENNYAGWDLSYLGQGELWYMGDDSPPYVYNDGDWLTAVFAFAPGSDSSTVSLHMVDGYGTVSFLTSHVVVPEPITLSLLALGGLFLRRRR